MERLIASIEKNASDELRVELSEYKGYDLVSLRVWTRARGDPRAEFVRTGKGFALQTKRLDELIAGLNKARETAKASGLLTREVSDGKAREIEVGRG